jgi:DTW domain-containing protein YfiP
MKNPWLLKFQTLSFANLPENQYIIRKAKRADSLSSLEAIAYSIEVLENADTQPLYKVLNKMMGSFIKH